jgi:hypothetical protein
MAVNLQNHWFLPFDNVSYINEETSDTLCRAITGGGIPQRRLNTNSEDAIFIFQRCIAINGINNAATRADLLDRSILVELVRIAESDRKELSEIISNFENDKADILGGIFDTAVKAVNIFPTVKLKNLPRMADFARWGYAIGESLGEGLGEIFLTEYTGNRQIQNDEAIANDPVATLIVEFMKNRREWTGLYSALYRQLADIAEPCGVNVKHKSFPANAIGLSKRITAIKSNMENVGISCEPERKTRLGQTLSIKRAILSSPSSHTDFSAENGALSGEDKREDRCEDKTAAYSSSHASSPSSSHEKPCNFGLCAECEDGADKNGAFTEGWYAVAKDISDEDIPPEFLTPAPPVRQPQTSEQISLQ